MSIKNRSTIGMLAVGALLILNSALVAMPNRLESDEVPMGACQQFYENGELRRCKCVLDLDIKECGVTEGANTIECPTKYPLICHAS